MTLYVVPTAAMLVAQHYLFNALEFPGIMHEKKKRKKNIRYKEKGIITKKAIYLK